MPEHEIDCVELAEDPQLHEEDDRTVVGASASGVLSKQPCQATVLPLGPGIYLPFRSGDKLLTGTIRGRKLMGVHPLAWAGDVVPPQSMRNLELRGTRGGNVVVAPDRAAEGSSVLLGRETRDGADYDEIMCFKQISAEVLNLKAQLDALVEWLQNPVSIGANSGGPVVGVPAGPGSASAAVALAEAEGPPGGIVGGESSIGVKAARQEVGPG